MKMKILIVVLFVLYFWAVDRVYPQNQRESVIHSQLNINTGKWENCPQSDGEVKFEVCFPAEAEDYRTTKLDLIFAEGTGIPMLYFTDLNTGKGIMSGVMGVSLSLNDVDGTPRVVGKVPYRTPYQLTRIFNSRPKEDFAHIAIVARRNTGAEGRVQFRINFK